MFKRIWRYAAAPSNVQLAVGKPADQLGAMPTGSGLLSVMRSETTVTALDGTVDVANIFTTTPSIAENDVSR